MIFMFLFVLFLYTMINYFIYHQLNTYIFSLFKINQTLFFIIYLLLTLSIFIPFIHARFPLKKAITTIASYWMGIFVYLFLFCLIGLILKKCIPLNITAMIIICLTAATVIYGCINASRVNLKEYTIDTNAQKLNIALISDIHLGSIGSTQRFKKTVELINKQNSDIVVIAGDIFDSDYTKIEDLETIKKFFHSIKSKEGIYACFGNHDAGKTYNQMKTFLKECNVHLLEDDYVNINNEYIIAGRVDGAPIGQSKTRIDSDTFINSIDSSLPLFVLDHTPSCITEYDNRVTLLMCGHTHAGQLFPFSYVTDLIFPCDYGYYRNNGPHVIVTSGCGLWGMPMRVGSQCEVVSIHLQ